MSGPCPHCSSQVLGSVPALAASLPGLVRCMVPQDAGGSMAGGSDSVRGIALRGFLAGGSDSVRGIALRGFLKLNSHCGATLVIPSECNKPPAPEPQL